MDDKGVCKDCNNRKYCADYKPNKWQCEDYEAQHTKEDWLCYLSTEKKAEWLSNTLYACMRCGMGNGKGYCPFGKCITEKDDAFKWLKEKHENG